MPSPLLRLAADARALRSAAIPGDVARLARLQHLAAAGATRAARATRAGARLAGDPVDRAAGLLARFAWDDPILGGRAPLGALPWLWHHADGHTLDELLTATVAANELAGRIGLATLAGEALGAPSLVAPVAAGATALALLTGRDEAGVAASVSGALSAARRSGLHSPLDRFDADPAGLGREIVRLVRRGVDDPGSTTLLDEGHPFWEEACARPLPGALHLDGWLTRTLVVSPEPGLASTHVAVQAVGEILRRHVKAAEKRLRPDQVDRVEIRVSLPVWAHDTAARPHEGALALTASIARLVAVRVAFHELTPALLDDGALADRADELATLASAVDVAHDWGLTTTALRATAAQLPPLTGLGLADYRAVRARLKPAGAWPRWMPEELPDLARARPDLAVAALRGGPTALGAAPWSLPVRVKLYTTRGGWWPERRAVPEGTVQGGDLEAVALRKFGDDARAAELLALPGSTPAATFLAGLLA